MKLFTVVLWVELCVLYVVFAVSVTGQLVTGLGSQILNSSIFERFLQQARR